MYCTVHDSTNVWMSFNQRNLNTQTYVINVHIITIYNTNVWTNSKICVNISPFTRSFLLNLCLQIYRKNVSNPCITGSYVFKAHSFNIHNALSLFGSKMYIFSCFFFRLHLFQLKSPKFTNFVIFCKFQNQKSVSTYFVHSTHSLYWIYTKK